MIFHKLSIGYLTSGRLEQHGNLLETLDKILKHIFRINSDKTGKSFIFYVLLKDCMSSNLDFLFNQKKIVDKLNKHVVFCCLKFGKKFVIFYILLMILCLLLFQQLLLLRFDQFLIFINHFALMMDIFITIRVLCLKILLNKVGKKTTFFLLFVFSRLFIDFILKMIFRS